MPRWAYSFAFSAVTALLGAIILVSPVGLLAEREFALGWLFKLRGPVAPPPEVTVVGINGASGTDLGLSRLPRHWPRSLHAVLTKRIMASGAEGVVFDMDFSQSRAAVEDLTFADAIRDAGRVVLFERLEGRNERLVSGNNVSRWVWIETAEPPVEALREAALAYAPFPLPKIEKSAAQFWAFKPSADDTPTTASVAVQIALLPHHQQWRYLLERAGVKSGVAPPASALTRPGILREHMRQMRKRFLGDPTLANRLRALLENSSVTPEDRRGMEVLIALYGGPDERYTNYYGPPGAIPTISFQDMVSVDELGAAASGDEVKPTETSQRLANRMVFVGYSDLFSPDQPDRFFTVFTNERGIDLSGCEIMATAFANLLTDSTIRPLDAWTSIALVLIFGIAVSQLIFWPSAYIAVPLALALGGAYTVGVALLFETELLWAPLATPLAVQLPFAVVFGLLGQYLVEHRQKLRASAAIAHYLPKDLAEDLTAGRLSEANLDQVVHGVCLATDMSGFSSISERKSPKELARFMNSYFEAIAQALKHCEVDVTEFHADTIMCAWIGGPNDPEVRRKAVQAAIEVVRAIEQFNAADPDVALTARIGLQDGPFYLGHTGGGGRLSYSILGDPANSAARLESLNKRFGTKILAADSVVAGFDEFVLRPLGDFNVVGKANAVSVVEVMEKRAAETDDLCRGFAESLEEFLAERWQSAADSFSRLTSRFPHDGATSLYLQVCREYVTNGPPEENPTRLAMTEK